MPSPAPRTKRNAARVAPLGATLPEVVRLYLEHASAHLRPGTVGSRRSALRWWLARLPTAPARPDVEHVILRAVSSGELERATANNYLTALGLAYGYARELAASAGWLPIADPSAGVRRFVVPEPDPKPLTDAQLAAVQRAADAAGPRASLWVSLLAREGLRRSEAQGLTAEDVDLRRGTVTVRRSRSVGSAVAGPTKSRSGGRVVPLSPETRVRWVAALREWRATAATAKGEAARRYPAHLSVHEAARLTEQLDAAAPGAFGKVKLSAAGQRRRLGGTLHRLRHTFGADLAHAPLGEGQTVREWLQGVQAALGHEHLSSTATYVGRLRGDARTSGSASVVQAARAARAAREAAAVDLPRIGLAAAGAAPVMLVPAAGGNKNTTPNQPKKRGVR